MTGRKLACVSPAEGPILATSSLSSWMKTWVAFLPGAMNQSMGCFGGRHPAAKRSLSRQNNPLSCLQSMMASNLAKGSHHRCALCYAAWQRHAMQARHPAIA